MSKQINETLILVLYVFLMKLNHQFKLIKEPGLGVGGGGG